MALSQLVGSPMIKAFIGLLFAYLLYRSPFSKKIRGKLPPSPPGSRIPGLGHALLLADQSSVFSTKLGKWAEELGPIYSLNVLGETMIVLNTYKVAKEMKNRSLIYAGRKELELVGKVVTQDASIAFLQVDDRWRAHRRATGREFSPSAVVQYNKIIERESVYLVRGISKQEGSLWDVSFRFAGSIGLGTVYDYPVEKMDDVNIKAWQTNLHELTNLLIPGQSYYDAIRKHLRSDSFCGFSPNVFVVSIKTALLRWLPDFFVPSKVAAEKTRAQISEAYARMARFAEKRYESGADTTSFHASMLQRDASGKPELSQFDRDHLSGSKSLLMFLRDKIDPVTTALMGGALDTTATTTFNLVLSLIVHPEAQRKLQEEVDRVVGRDRLPNKEDLPNLHYCRAIVLESQRWRGTARAGVPRRVVQDDYFDGYLIPAGATVVINAWSISQDPVEFPDPQAFKPERYLHADGTFNSSVLVVDYGFGRRVCPGQHLAITSLQMAVACLGWAFTFSPKTDAAGKPIVPDTSADACSDFGLVFPAKPFEYEVIARDDQVASLIEQTAASYVHE